MHWWQRKYQLYCDNSPTATGGCKIVWLSPSSNLRISASKPTFSRCGNGVSTLGAYVQAGSDLFPIGLKRLEVISASSSKGWHPDLVAEAYSGRYLSPNSAASSPIVALCFQWLDGGNE